MVTQPHQCQAGGVGLPWAVPRSPPPAVVHQWCQCRAPLHHGTGSRRGTGECCGFEASWQGSGYLQEGRGRVRGTPRVLPGQHWGPGEPGLGVAPEPHALIRPRHPSGRPSCPAKQRCQGSVADTNAWRPPTAPDPAHPTPRVTPAGPPVWPETPPQGRGAEPGGSRGSGAGPRCPVPGGTASLGGMGAGPLQGRRGLRPFFSPPPDNSLVSLAESSAPEARGQSERSARPWAPFPQSPLAERRETEAEGLPLPTLCPRGSATAPAPAPLVPEPGPTAARAEAALVLAVPPFRWAGAPGPVVGSPCGRSSPLGTGPVPTFAPPGPGSFPGQGHEQRPPTNSLRGVEGTRGTGRRHAAGRPQLFLPQFPRRRCAHLSPGSGGNSADNPSDAPSLAGHHRAPRGPDPSPPRPGGYRQPRSLRAAAPAHLPSPGQWDARGWTEAARSSSHPPGAPPRAPNPPGTSPSPLSRTGRG